MSKIPELLKERATWLRKQAEEQLTEVEALGHCATHLLEKAAHDTRSVQIAEQFLQKAKDTGAIEKLAHLVSDVEDKLATDALDVAAVKIAEAARLGMITKEAAVAVVDELRRRKAQ